jgi:hypothetical protein
VIQDEFPDWNEVLKSSRVLTAQSLSNDSPKTNEAYMSKSKKYVAGNSNTSGSPRSTIIIQNRFTNLEVESTASTHDTSMASDNKEVCYENEGDIDPNSQPIHKPQTTHKPQAIPGNRSASKGRPPHNDKTLHFSASATGGPSDTLIPT